jgi:hypothetical protein
VRPRVEDNHKDNPDHWAGGPAFELARTTTKRVPRSSRCLRRAGTMRLVARVLSGWNLEKNGRKHWSG